ncbi:PfkB family carbohydrate kinase [Spirochaeta isovalerica]|uniref:Ribokinase n=1 Tax=Spirochaeta isovalerica TaxID=150 RepID=A0A841RF24_9SPIO|nr:ribokinase [Spirochaeta isovalerica]
MKILNFGSLNIDLVFRVDHIILPGETLSGGDVEYFAGGKGANQSVALSKAGAEVFHGGKIGEDGRWLLDKLNSYGVNTDFVKVYDGPSGQAIIQLTPRGENSIILSAGGNRKIEEKDIEQTLSSFSEGDYLVLQNEINGTEGIIRRAREKGMRICINPAPFDSSILSWPLDLVDILIVNEHEGAGLAGASGAFEEILDKLTRLFPGKDIVMTAGVEGAYYGCDDERIHVPAVKADAVDTTAAGDTFLGYYLAARIDGTDVRKAMEMAAEASAVTVSRPGAMDSIPFAAELKD